MATEQTEKDLRPEPKEYDKMQIEAQVERDIELRSYESKRLVANLRFEIAKNMGNEQMMEQAKRDLIGIESAIGQSVLATKERLLISVDRIFEYFDAAMKIDPEGSYQQRVNNFSDAEMIYLAHMMGKEVNKVSDQVDPNDLVIPLTVTPTGMSVYLLLSNGSLWLQANKLK